MTNQVVELDVREDLARKQDPFHKIMGAIDSFQAGDTLILHAPFQPIPLYQVLSAKNFTHETEELGEKHFKVTFKKQL